MVKANFKPQIFSAKTMHKRFSPKINRFIYSIYYLYIPLSEADDLELLKPLINFSATNHGYRDGSDLHIWAREVLRQHEIELDGEIILLAIPTVLGYVFNPVSFWLCYDKQSVLRAVIAEVNNTFGESHSYVCAHENLAEINPQDVLNGEKVFHVSPFMERKGEYEFRFDVREGKIAIFIDYFLDGKKMLATNLIGNLSELSRGNLLRHFITQPLLTVKVIFLIHYQALKIIAKGISYIAKPEQLRTKITKTYKSLISKKQTI